MFLTPLAAIMVAASGLEVPEQAAPPMPKVAATYVGREWRDAQQMRFARYDIRFTNREATRQTFRTCPDDSNHRFAMRTGGTRRNQVFRNHAYALAVDGSSYIYRCVERELAPDASITIGFYFGHDGNKDIFTGPITLKTSLGTFEVIGGKVVRTDASPPSSI